MAENLFGDNPQGKVKQKEDWLTTVAILNLNVMDCELI